MLKRFTISNYRSFYDEAELNLIADKDTIYTKKINNEYISKLCLLYGYNGCGKSNLLNALKYIFYSNNGYIISSDDSIKRLLDPNMIYGKNENSRFYLEFYSYDDYEICSYELILDNNNKRIHLERFKKNNTVIFEREKNTISDGIFNYDDSIADTNTFLSFFNNKLKDINEKADKYREEINYYISLFKNLCFLFPFTNESDFSSYAILEIFEYFNKYNIWDTYKKLLYMTDIDDLNIVDSINANNFSFMLDNKRLVSRHDSYSNDFDEVESEGSKVYAINLIYILSSIINGTLSIVDEFNGVQSELLEFTIRLFKKGAFNDIERETSQLILSTHDITLMSIDDTLLFNYFLINKKNNITRIYRADELKNINKDLNISNLEREYRKNHLGISR
ncbi:AAA family ATPase [Brachyspira murdochii]|uniref:Abortive infection protein n=1 Tax=Brachyspira murdochii TaxID=84378 RepID=A0ABX5B5F2_9SPIR|nr:AAA family ATPase [Brachyspira murdochii]PPS22511.1 abortive infection protein [Brachyspira murdochii]